MDTSVTIEPTALSEALAIISDTTPSNDGNRAHALTTALSILLHNLLDQADLHGQMDRRRIDMLRSKLERAVPILQRFGAFFMDRQDKILLLAGQRKILQSGVAETKLSYPFFQLSQKLVQTLMGEIHLLDQYRKFFADNSAQQGIASVIAELDDRSLAPAEKIKSLERDVKNMEATISRLQACFKEFIGILSTYELGIYTINESLQKQFSTTHDIPSDTDADIHRMPDGSRRQRSDSDQPIEAGCIIEGDPHFTRFLEDIFAHVWEDYKPKQYWVSDMIAIAQSRPYELVRSGQLLDDEVRDVLLNVFEFLSDSIAVYGPIYREFREIVGDGVSSWSTVRFSLGEGTIVDAKADPLDLVVDNRFTTMPLMFHDQVERITSGKYLHDLNLKNSQTGNAVLVSIKKRALVLIANILEKMRTIPEYRESPECAKKDMKLLCSLKKRYNQLLSEIREERAKALTKGTEFTFHYKVDSGKLSGVTGLSEVYLDNNHPPIVGRTIREINDRIHRIVDRQSSRYVLKTFPGADNSLEGNIIVVGPLGTGKTGYVRMLAANPDIATIETSYGDMASPYVGNNESNIPELFRFAQKKAHELGKEIYICIDEFDGFFRNPIDEHSIQARVQKEFQQALDGMHAYPRVHLIGISNNPKDIPADIYRRMGATVIIQPIDILEKIELIQSRLVNIPIDPDIATFFTRLSDPALMDQSAAERYFGEHHADKELSLGGLYPTVALQAYVGSHFEVPDQSRLAQSLVLVTPKMVSVISERAFNSAISRIWSDSMTAYPAVWKSSNTSRTAMIAPTKHPLFRLNRDMKRLYERKKIATPADFQALYRRYGVSVSMEDMIKATRTIFANATTEQEIRTNQDFYSIIAGLMEEIKGSYDTRNASLRKSQTALSPWKTAEE